MNSKGSITVVDSGVQTASGQGSQSILTGTPTAGSFVTAPLAVDSSVGVQITGTWTGTLSFERSLDGGITYVPAPLFLEVTSTITTVNSVTGNCVLFGPSKGATHWRVRSTAAMTGSAAILIQTGYNPSVIHTA